MRPGTRGSIPSTRRRAPPSRRSWRSRGSWSRSPSSRRSEMGRFTGKVAVVTGAGGGIGRASAARLAAEGASLVLVDRVAGTLKDTQAAVERAGAATLAVEADVTRWDDVQRYTTAATERFGGIDAFFNNAGILGDVSPLTEYSEATFDRVMAVNVKGVWLGLKAVAPALGARGGIRVNAVCPAPIDTPMVRQFEASLGEGAHERLLARIPLQRFGEADEVAALVVFLLSAEASYVNGGIYTVDGGSMA